MAGGLTEPVRRIRDTLATSRHAQMLFDMVVARLGALAIVETANGETILTLYRRETPDAESIIPWPLLQMSTTGRLSTVVMVVAPEGEPHEPPPRPGEAPKLRGLGPGQIVLHDGPETITVTYGEDGRWKETSRSAQDDTHAGVIAALDGGSAHATELLAAYVAGIDLARHGPGRVLRPVALPTGVGSLWRSGLMRVRDALFDERIPPDTRWVAADGFDGSALSWGPTPKEALASWREEVVRKRPKPKIVEAPANPEPDSVERIEEGPGRYGVRVRMSGPMPDLPWPELGPEDTPVVLIELERCPHQALAWGTWICLLGHYGGSVFALLKRDLEGCVLVGESLAEVIDLATIEESLDVADAQSGAPPTGPRKDWPAHLPTLNSSCVTYECVEDGTHVPMPPRAFESRQEHGFHTGALDGDKLRWRVLRQRWLDV